MRKHQKVILFFAIFIFVGTFALGYLFKQQNKRDVIIPSPSSIDRTAQVKVFFSNTREDPDVMYCDRTYPVERTVTLKSDVDGSEPGELAYLAIKELLDGPTDEDKANGFFTSINPETKVQKITIIDGVGTVDFNEFLDKNVAGSCKVMAIRSQIVETLSQLPEVNEVVISINGESEQILQP